MSFSFALERTPELGSKPVSLTVKLPAASQLLANTLTDGLREFYRRGDLTDVALVCGDRTFLAHRAVLAAQSEVFLMGLANAPAAKDGRQEIRLADISNPEAVKSMLDHLYGMDGSYNPRCQEINTEVLRLAANFRLPGLTEKATHWLAKGLSTGNVVEVLTVCEEFGLASLGDRILEQLTQNRVALAEIAGSPQIMKHPKLMQALLQQAAAAHRDKDDEKVMTPPKQAQPKKRGAAQAAQAVETGKKKSRKSK